MNLRDHSQPCEHKLDSGWDAAYQSDGVWLCRTDGTNGCPGNLRAACEHGRYEAHQFAATYAKEPEPCPGGREVTIDYKAAYQQYADEYGLKNHEQVRRIVAAAIGTSNAEIEVTG